MSWPLPHLRHLASEFGRRRVWRVAAAYGAAGFVLVEAASIVFPQLGVPDVALTLLILVVILGFPVALVLSWAFDITPEGVRRTRDARRIRDPRRIRDARPDAEASPSGDPPETEEAAATATADRRLLRYGFLTSTLLLTVAVGWASWELWLGPGDPSGAQASEGELDPTHVAVLYFDDRTPDEDLSYLADGFTDALNRQLDGVEALEVSSLLAVKQFRDADVAPETIARTLGAGILIQGSVQRSGDSVQVTPRLIDGTTGSQVASVVRTRPWGEILELQDDLARAVADELRARLGRELELRRRQRETESLGAWEHVHRAERARDEAEGLRREGDRRGALRRAAAADSLLAEAERMDPEWVEPIVLRGRLALDRHRYASGARATDPAAWLEEALRHAERALERRAGHPDALALRGTALWQRWRRAGEPADLEEAERSLRAAVDADPSLAGAWATLSTLLHEGRMELREARLAARRAYEEDAFLESAEEILYRLSYLSLELEEYEEARRWTLEGQRRFPGNLGFPTVRLYGLASRGGPEPAPEEARRLAAEIERLSPPDRRLRNTVIGRLQVAAVLARAGWADSAEAVLASVRGETPDSLERDWLSYDEAHVRLLLGDTARALELLEGYAELYPQDRVRLARDHWFEPLWSHPRYRAVAGVEPTESARAGKPANQ